MKLTTEQRSEIISEMASSEAGFNELMRVLLDSFSKQERALFLEEHKGEQGNGFRPRRWRGHGCSFQLRIPRYCPVKPEFLCNNKVTKEAEIPQEGFSLIFRRVKLLPDSNRLKLLIEKRKFLRFEIRV